MLFPGKNQNRNKKTDTRRNGEFEPVVVPKNKRNISGIEQKVISLYTRGMSTRNIHDQIKDIYRIEMSAEMVNKITDRLIPEIQKMHNTST